MKQKDEEVLNIGFWDNENYEYPIIKIKEKGYKQFEIDLKKYRDYHQSDYNFDDFCDLIQKKSYFVEIVSKHIELFF